MSEQRCAEVATYVVGDVHGQFDGLVDALRACGLLDEEDNWTGGCTRLWFVGDFVDRGPDGVAVIDLVMRLQEQAAKVGGQVESLLGNHEILLLGVHHFGDTEVPSDSGSRNFTRSWEMNGGQPADQEALRDEHVDWLHTRPVLAHVAGCLLMHSDTVAYLNWGGDVDEINTTVREILASDDLAAWWDVWRRLTSRYAFRGADGAEVATALLEHLGGEQVVHGHSVIADQLGVSPAEIEQPYCYASGKVLGVDGGLFAGGPCLVTPLPWQPQL